MNDNNTTQSHSPNELEREELKSARKHLIILSTLLIAFNLSGAQVKEANSFIFKIEFANSEGLYWLVFSSVIYLLLRYHSICASKLEAINNVWLQKCVYDPFFYSKDPGDDIDGFFHRLCKANKNGWTEDGDVLYGSNRLNFRIIPNLVLNAKLEIEYFDFEHQESFINNYSFFSCNPKRDYLIAIFKVLQYFAKHFFRFPQGLSYYSPYWIGLTALYSHFLR